MRNIPDQIRQFRSRFARRRSRGLMVNTEHKLHDHSTPPDVASPRAKSQRKGKVTADRWNQ
jgi:hypothetical protein